MPFPVWRSVLWSVLLALGTASVHGQHVFYLHGRIVELQGVNAVSETFGPYRYNEILDSLGAHGATVHSEVRTDLTDFYAFAHRISAQIDSLVAAGVPPAEIGVIGASKGAVMAMYVSSVNVHPVRYVLLAANNDEVERQNQRDLHGAILGIYERSDAIAGKPYDYWIARSTSTTQFEQLELDTGLSHGFLYRPLGAWLGPARTWLQQGCTGEER